MPVGTAGKMGYLYLGFELDGEGRSILRDLERHAPLIVQQEQHITLEEGAYLEYLPEPIIPCCHTRFIADTTIRIAPSGTLFYAEIYTSGRTHYTEASVSNTDILSVCTHAERPDGKTLFREKFVIRPNTCSPTTLGKMGGYDIFANVIVLTPEEHAERIYSLTSPFIDRERRLAAGSHRCGLIYKVLGCDTGQVKRLLRRFCSTVRTEVKGKPLPEEFPWR